MPHSSIIKPWILTASTNYSANGKLFLGQVLRDPLDPGSALISGKPRVLPESLHIEQTTAENPTLTSQDLLQHSGGFWLESHGLDAGVSAEGNSLDGSTAKWEVKRMVGKLTTFSLDYVKGTVLQEKDIKDFVKSSPWTPRLYIITGVRIFSNAKLVGQTAGHVTNSEARATIDGTRHQIPARGGLKAQSSHAHVFSQSFDKTTDFIFAYMCNKINYLPWLRMSSYTAGQTASSEQVVQQGDPEEGLELGLCNDKPHVEVEGFGAGEEADDVAHKSYRLSCISEGVVSECDVRYFSGY